MSQNINYIPNEPSLKDLLDFMSKEIKLSLNCHHIGTIQSFDSSFQTAQVSINYTKTFLQIDDVGNTSVQSVNYPVLASCPVICLGGGLGSMTFPIAPGDECLVLFNDRDLDNWFNGSANSPPATGRLHSFTDAMALVGVRSLSNVLTSYNTEAPEIRMGGNKITLASDKAVVSLSTGVTLELDSTGKLKITNLTGEFVSSLVQLFTDIQNATTNTIFGPTPLLMPTFTTDLTILQSFKS